MIDRKRLRKGMTVHSADGHKLGKVIELDANTFVIEKGHFFPKDFVARYEDVADVLADDVRLTRGREALAEIGGTFGEDAFSGASSAMGPGGGFETAPAEEDVELEERLRRDRAAERQRERAAEQRAAADELTGEDIQRSIEEGGGEADYGEDPGTLIPHRREPEE